MKKTLFILCSFILLLVVSGSNILLILFTGNILEIIRIDQLQANFSLPLSFAINIFLLLLFGLQHSLMARPQFKIFSRQFIPQGLERMFYSILSGVILIGLVLFWQPIPIVLWKIEIEWVRILVYTFFFLGWILVLVSSNLIDGFELTGIRQLAVYFLEKENKLPAFKTPILYKIVRHPIYLGFLIAFWATPLMTLSHLLFSIGMTIYILIGIHYEEKHLLTYYGDEYRSYQKTTPKLFPKKLSLN